MTTVLRNDDVCKASKSAMIRMPISESMVQAIAETVAKEGRLNALVAKLVSKRAEQEVNEAARRSVLVVPPSLRSSVGSSFSSKEKLKPPQN